ncbi:MAG: cardiolipin synthase [Oscillospiraceae bacterium]
MRKLLRFVFSKRFLAAVLAVIQLLIFFVLMTKFYTIGPTIYILMTVFSIAILLYLFERDNLNPSYKLLWVLVMVILPVTGAVFYFLWGDTKLTKGQQRKLEAAQLESREHLQPNADAIEQLTKYDPRLAKQAKYLENHADAPAYYHTTAKYYPMGEDFFKDYMEDLKGAKEHIFIQYFIIDEGYMWDTILEVLKEKAAQGVDVRVVFDGFGTLLTLPSNYDKTLEKFGIKAQIFNTVKFSFKIGDYLMLNHRDHRKITVIDSCIGYGGGVNLADEYINVVQRFGTWKDTAFRLKGEGVFSLTATFLQTWKLLTGENVDYEKYRPHTQEPTDGIVQPYFDTPLDKSTVCENAYLSIINNAMEYVYITTPYLIIDNEMVTSLCLAAQSGIDVKIMVPGIPDKWYVYYITQSYYRILIEAGVKIFEYTPGFLHAKMYVSDDSQAVVGSANMDYRSMYLHYENCCSFYGSGIVMDVKQDFLQAEKLCHLVTLEDVKKTPLWKRIFQILFRVWSPMM